MIGFVGRTGDAYPTPPHLHFEIHPRPLLHLHYEGAVDPTSYLEAWPHETPAQVRLPTRPRAPKGMPRLEAAVVWRQLLSARHLTHRTTKAPQRTLAPPPKRSPGLHAARLAVGRAGGRRGRAPDPLLLGLGSAAVAVAAAFAAQRRLGRFRRPGSDDVRVVPDRQADRAGKRDNPVVYTDTRCEYRGESGLSSHVAVSVNSLQ